MRRTLVALCVVALLLSGCGSSSTAVPSPTPLPTATPTQPAAEVQRTVVRFAISDLEVPIYENLIATFEEQNPDLDVQVVSVNQVLELSGLTDTDIPEDAEQRLVAAADVVSMGASHETVRLGLLRDLTPFLEADANFDAEDFVAGSLESYQWEGGTWALPTVLNFRLIYYSKDAFDAAGVAYPEAGWTWDDLTAKAVALTERQGDEVARWGFVCPLSRVYWLLESRVGPLADYSVEPPTAQFERPDILEALRWYADLRLEKGAIPFAQTGESEGQAAMSYEGSLIDKGQAAMWPDYDALWWYRGQQAKVGVVPFPQTHPNAASTPAWAQGLVMSAGTQQPQAAWRWMDFLSRQVLRSFGQGMTSMPARRSAAESSGYWDKVDAELAHALRYAVEHGYTVRAPAGYDALQDAVAAALSGEQTPEEALAAAQAKLDEGAQVELAEQAGATPAPTVVVAPLEEEPTASSDAVTITFMPGLGSFNLEPYRLLADRFRQEHPDIIVEVKMLDVTGGTAPDLPTLAETTDCFQWYPSLQDPKNREALLAISAFLDADPSFTTDDYFPQALQQFTYQGELWGLPADVTPYVVEYNKDLFDAAGVAYPTIGWTWDDFLEAALALTEGEGEEKQYGYVAEAFESSDMLLMIERLGATLIDESTEPASFTFTDPTVVEAVEWYALLSTEHEVKPVYITDITKLLGAGSAYMEREALINEGRAAMWTNSGTTAAIFGPRAVENMGTAPLPAAADGSSRGSLLTISGYFISASTDSRLACWQWLTFLSEQPDAVMGLPARRSVAESDAYRALAGAERAEAYMASVSGAEKPSALQAVAQEDWLGAPFVWVYQAYGKVVRDEAPAGEALDEAQKMAEEYRACVLGASDFSQATWEGCLKETDPSLPGFLFSASGG